MMLHGGQTDRRHTERVRFREALVARFGTSTVLVVDLSPFGAGIEHFSPLKRDAQKQLRFAWRDEAIGIPCRVLSCRIHRFAPGDEGITVYRSGLQFEVGEGLEIEHIRAILTETLESSFLERVANERGVAAPAPANFQRGILRQPAAADHGEAEVPRLRRSAGYIRFAQVKGRWERKWTLDPAQPADGFTIPADEAAEQVDLLCSVYEKGNEESRRLIRDMAAISVDEQTKDP